MTQRVTRKTVSFRHPFELTGVEGAQPAGTYTVETAEEPIGGLSSTAYRRVSTTIELASHQFGPAARQVVTIDPLDLEAAQTRDAARLPHGPSQVREPAAPRPWQRQPTRTQMISMSRFVTDAQAQFSATVFHVVLTGSVFAFLTMMILL